MSTFPLSDFQYGYQSGRSTDVAFYYFFASIKKLPLWSSLILNVPLIKFLL